MSGGGILKKYFIVISLLLVILCVFFLYSLKPENDNNQQMINKVRINFWVYSPELLKTADQFEKEYPNVRVVKRLLKNSTILLEELYAAQSSGNPPDFAEMPSWYGIYPLIETGAILSVDEFLLGENAAELPSAFEKRFRFKDKLWAIPVSYEVPLLYVNEAVFAQGKIPTERLDSVANVMEIATELNSDGLEWGINSDKMYPWYLMNLYEESGEITEQVAARLTGDYKVFLFHTNHLALTQFVNGEGGILISTSGKLKLIEKLIGSKFKWNILPFPVASEEIIPNGNGIVIFNKENANSEYMKQFLSFLQEEEQLKNIAIEQSVIPANTKLILDDSFLQYYRHFQGYENILIDSLKAEGRILTPRDEADWRTILYANENRE